MIKRIIIYVVGAILPWTVWAQSTTESVLQEIEKNNSTLQALRYQAEAQKINNKTGIFLTNPQVGFNYLWGSPTEVGNKIALSATQSFDFPSAYKLRNQVANLKNNVVEWEYQKQRIELLFEARKKLVELAYYNARAEELQKRLKHAQDLAAAYKKMLDAGETNILEYNKTQNSLLMLQQDYQANHIAQTTANAELTRLNEGKEIHFMETHLVDAFISRDFEQWYKSLEEKNPVLGWAKEQVLLSQKEIQLSKTLTLPKFSVGYTGEIVPKEKFHGVALGLSIPLWETRNMVKAAEANRLTYQQLEQDNKRQFYQKLKNLHAQAIQLQDATTKYKQQLERSNNEFLLQKALDKGEINLLTYLMELSLYYAGVDKLLEAEKSMNETLAELYRYGI